MSSQKFLLMSELIEKEDVFDEEEKKEINDMMMKQLICRVIIFYSIQLFIIMPIIQIMICVK